MIFRILRRHIHDQTNDFSFTQKIESIQCNIQNIALANTAAIGDSSGKELYEE